MTQIPAETEKRKIYGVIKMDPNSNIKNPKNDDSSEENLSGNDNSDNEEYRTGRWHPSEHVRFIKGCLQYGNNWKKVKECVKTRSSAQIRSHAQKYIIKLCKKFNIHDNKQLKSFRNLKRQINDVNGDILCNNLLPDLNSDVNNISGCNMEQIEEIILGIFKSSNNDIIPNKKVNPQNIDNLNFGFDELDSFNSRTEEKKIKVFETTKEPKSKFKKNKNSNMAGIDSNANNASNYNNMNLNKNMNNNRYANFGMGGNVSEDPLQMLLASMNVGMPISNMPIPNMSMPNMPPIMPNLNIPFLNNLPYEQVLQLLNFPNINNPNHNNKNDGMTNNLLNYLLMSSNAEMNEDMLNSIVKNMNLKPEDMNMFNLNNMNNLNSLGNLNDFGGLGNNFNLNCLTGNPLDPEGGNPMSGMNMNMDGFNMDLIMSMMGGAPGAGPGLGTGKNMTNDNLMQMFGMGGALGQFQDMPIPGEFRDFNLNNKNSSPDNTHQVNKNYGNNNLNNPHNAQSQNNNNNSNFAQLPIVISTSNSANNQIENNLSFAGIDNCKTSSNNQPTSNIDELQSLQQMSDILKVISGHPTGVQNSNFENSLSGKNEEKVNVPQNISNNPQVELNMSTNGVSNPMINPMRPNENIVPDDVSMNMLLNLLNNNGNNNNMEINNLLQFLDMQNSITMGSMSTMGAMGSFNNNINLNNFINQRKSGDATQTVQENKIEEDRSLVGNKPQTTNNNNMQINASNPFNIMNTPNTLNFNDTNFNNMSIPNMNNNFLNDPMMGLMNQFLIGQNPQALNFNSKNLDNLFMNNFNPIDYYNMDPKMMNLNTNPNNFK